VGSNPHSPLNETNGDETMRIFDLLTVTPANRTLSIYDRDNKFVENVGMKEMLEEPDHNNLYLLEIDRIIPTNCKYVLQVVLK
jgi:hypothetical protein